MPIDPTTSTLQRLAQSRPTAVHQPLAEVQLTPVQSNDPSLLYDMRNAVSTGQSDKNSTLQQTAAPDPYSPYSTVSHLGYPNTMTPFYNYDQPNNGQRNQGSLAELASGGNPTLSLIREFEGFRETPYWDVNAYRTGYGSDTITRSDGSVVPVRQGMRVSREDANRDLARRAQDFSNTARGQVGAGTWRNLSQNQQAVLTSIAYNYGSLPNSVVRAMTNGGDVVGSIRSLSRHNDGINADRRMREAAIFAAG